MEFTERQRNEIKNISKEMSKEIMNEFINDKNFMETFASKIVDIVSQKVSEHVDKLCRDNHIRNEN